MTTKNETKESVEKVESKFTKQQLLKSSRFSNRIDALSLVVKDGEELTITEVQKRLDEFMKKSEVKK